MRRLLLLALVPCVTANAGAQIMGRGGLRFQQPTTWMSASAALMQPWTVRDGRSGATWDFSDATEYGLSLERTFSTGASAGLRGSHARVPLRYTETVGGDAIYQADADADVTQLMALVHVTSGREFHSVLELALGATLYSAFRDRANGAKIGPDAPDADFTFAFGYGIGYAFSPAFSIDVVQDLSTVLHQKSGLGAGDKSSARINRTRLVGRFGFGGH